jgi:ferredoxin-NADP reductase
MSGPSNEALLLRVHARKVVADGVVEIELRAPGDGLLPSWTPGAHIGLHLSEGLVRQYSLCGDLSDQTSYTVAVLREADGRGGSAYVHDKLQPGVELFADSPRNNFELVDAPGYLLIGGGIGITPLRAMTAALGERQVPWRLVYGARSRAAMAYGDELAARYPGHVVLVPQDTSGLIPVAGLLAGADSAHAVYCCGPEPLLSAVEERCRSTGRPAPHVERFLAAPVSSAGDESVEVVLEQAGLTLQVGSRQSILEAIEEAGVVIDSSCREGTCGTCETRVLAGVPDHRDVLLSEAERAANDTMFVCVSRARGGRLVLDL